MAGRRWTEGIHVNTNAAKVIYRPVGLVSSVLGGLVAGVLFKQVWRRIEGEGEDGPPDALQSQYSVGQVLFAAAIEGAIYSVVKAGVDRVGASPSRNGSGSGPASDPPLRPETATDDIQPVKGAGLAPRPAGYWMKTRSRRRTMKTNPLARPAASSPGGTHG